MIPKGLPRSCTSVPCPTPPAEATPATSRPPRPGRAPDITPRSTSRPDHVLAVRAGDDVREAATLDAERGVPDAIPPAWSRSSAAAMSSSWSSRIETTCPAPPRLEGTYGLGVTPSPVPRPGRRRQARQPASSPPTGPRSTPRWPRYSCSTAPLGGDRVEVAAAAGHLFRATGRHGRTCVRALADTHPRRRVHDPVQAAPHRPVRQARTLPLGQCRAGSVRHYTPRMDVATLVLGTEQLPILGFINPAHMLFES